MVFSIEQVSDSATTAAKHLRPTPSWRGAAYRNTDTHIKLFSYDYYMQPLITIVRDLVEQHDIDHADIKVVQRTHQRERGSQYSVHGGYCSHLRRRENLSTTLYNPSLLQSCIQYNSECRHVMRDYWHCLHRLLYVKDRICKYIFKEQSNIKRRLTYQAIWTTNYCSFSMYCSSNCSVLMRSFGWGSCHDNLRDFSCDVNDFKE